MAATYDFHTLSPLDFEELVHDLLEAQWNTKLEAFGPGRDQGIDLRYLNGHQKFIVQAKHFLGSGYRGLIRALSREREKALRLAPDRYILATSVSLTPQRKDELIAAMNGVALVPGDIIGQEELNAMLRQHPNVERTHFKLWLSSTAVLERILHSGVYNRTAAEMDIIRAMVPRFVQNKGVALSLEKLAASGALIIAGPPGIGKTTLARMLLWLHAEQGWKVFVVDDLDDAFKVADPSEKRIILLDDFLGQVRLSPDLVRGVDARLPPLIARVSAHENLRFVLTSRDYILAQARGLSARLAPGQINAREYVLNVDSYTRAVKARILYNHIYFSNLTLEQRSQLISDNFYLKIIDHRNFNPRLVQEISTSDYLALTDRPIRQTIGAVLDNPELLWERPYRQHISKEGRFLMIAQFLNGASSEVSALKISFVRVSRALGQEIHRADLEPIFRSTFKSLEGSVLGLRYGTVIFANPGLRDFLQSVVITDRLVPLLLPEVETYSEVRELWAVFLAGKPSETVRTALASEWTAALDRMLNSRACNRYEYLELAIDIATELGSEAIEMRIDHALTAFEDEPIDVEEVSSACSLLEKSRMCTLSWQLEERLRRVVTVAGAALLTDHASELSFEDIQSLDNSLHDYGADEELAQIASHQAMVAVARSIASEVGSIETVEELDEFGDNILNFIRKRNFPTDSVTRDIDRRRDRLIDEGHFERREAYHGNGMNSSEKAVSSEEIKSMFRGIEEA